MEYFHRHLIHLGEVIVKNQQNGTYFKGNMEEKQKTLYPTVLVGIAMTSG